MISIRENIDIREMTTFGVPAGCGRLVVFSDPQAELPVLDKDGMLDHALIIGGGSNMLFTTGHTDLTVLHPANKSVTILSDDSADGNLFVKADAGVVLDDLCAMMADNGLWGTENLSGIPGMVGGAAVQNVGAYGTEFKDIVESVECYSAARHEFVTLSNSECRYGYRDSIFKHLPAGETLIVCHVTLKLSRAYAPRLSYAGLTNALAAKGLTPSPADNNTQLTPGVVRDTVISLRDSKLPDPAVTGSAGSFFKNPVISDKTLAEVVRRWESHCADASSTPLNFHRQTDGSAKLSAAWLIDKAGCKGFTEGGASLWPTQPLVIVNTSGTATGQEIVALEKKIIKQVEDVFGISLSPEVIHI